MSPQNFMAQSDKILFNLTQFCGTVRQSYVIRHKTLAQSDKHVSHFSQFSVLWDKIRYFAAIFRHSRTNLFSTSNFFRQWNQIVIHFRKRSAVLDKIRIFCRKHWAQSDKIVIHLTNFLTLWDKTVIQFSKFSVLWDKIVIHSKKKFGTVK